MKLALRYIPTEVWVDVICYPWITRNKLGKIAHKFRNRYFAEILQYCLHERGKQTLGHLQFNEDGIYKCVECETNTEEKLDVVQTPMPENIKFFERIEIKHFDSSTLGFLHQISTLFTDNDVNLRFGFEPDDDLASLRFVLDHLCPLLHGIHSLAFHQSAIPLMEQYFTPKLAQIKMLALNLGSAPADPATAQAINFCMNWLVLEGRDPAEQPKFLVVRTRSENFQQFSMAVKQQFRSAKSVCTFAFAIIDFDRHNNNNRIAGFHLKNNLGERLHGKSKINDNSIFNVVRLQPNGFTALQEWIYKVTAEQDNNTSCIEFLHNANHCKCWRQ